jgi:hypothetical protein
MGFGRASAMRALAGRPPVVLRAAGCLALFSVLAVPVFGLAGVFPRINGLISSFS